MAEPERASTPRVSTRALVVVALVLVVVLLGSVIGYLVLLHQPRLAPVPVPTVSQL